jgi:hypothetical protein
MRIKLFEGFNRLFKEEIESSLVELRDLGYTLIIEEDQLNCYEVVITDNSREADPFFEITEVIEPIYILISFLQEKFGDNFDYTLKYFDGNYEDDYEYINHVEDYIDDQELMNDLTEIGPTHKMILKIEINNEN